MLEKYHKSRYNDRVVVVHEENKTIYKLYRDGKLIYIGVKENGSISRRFSNYGYDSSGV
jgi:hypothetical protein